MAQQHPVKPVPVFWEPAFWDMSEYQASTNAPSCPWTGSGNGRPGRRTFWVEFPAARPSRSRRSWPPGGGGAGLLGVTGRGGTDQRVIIHQKGPFRGWRRQKGVSSTVEAVLVDGEGKNRSSSTKKGVFVDEIGGRRWRDGRSPCHPRHRKRGDRNGGERQRTE